MSIGGIDLPKAENLKPFKPLNLSGLSASELVERDNRLQVRDLEAALDIKPPINKETSIPVAHEEEKPKEQKTSFSVLVERPDYPVPKLPVDLTTEANSGSIGLVRGDQLSLSVNLEEGGYTVSSLLMSSCQGEIWLVTDPDGRTCALKIQDLSKFLSQKQADRIAKSQIRAYEQLQEKPHPNIVNSFKATSIPNPIYIGNDTENSQSLPVFLLERFEGDILKNQEIQQLDLETKISIINQIASGIDHLHKNKILHCQLTPSSIIVGSGDLNGKDKVVKIAELGFAVNSDDTKNVFKEFIGSFDNAFVSANLRSDGDPSAEDDLYSYGAIVFYTLTGKEPFISYDIENSNYLAQNLRPIETLMPNLQPQQARRLNELFAEILCSNGFKKFNSAQKIAETVVKILTEKESPGLLQKLFKGN